MKRPAETMLDGDGTNHNWIQYWLVVSTPMKNMKVNGKDDNPYIMMENKTCLKPPTRIDNEHFQLVAASGHNSR